MDMQRFGGVKNTECSPNLYVANCGPAVGLAFESIAAAFGVFGQVRGVYDADETGTRVIVAFGEEGSARAAFHALNGKRCSDLNDRVLHIRHSMLKLTNKSSETVPVSLVFTCGMILSAVTRGATTEVDSRLWNNLAKRRVQHYGYEFCYNTRNIDTTRRMGELPSFLATVLGNISSLPEVDAAEAVDLDQVTICPFTWPPFFNGIWLPRNATNDALEVATTDTCSSFLRKVLYLPRRSLLLLSGEERYAWRHYIPHHKVDFVNNNMGRRELRRVSFTIRKVRRGVCQCEFSHMSH